MWNKFYFISLWNWRTFALSFGLIYALYQAHKLPSSLARIVGRIYFFPTWPLTYWSRRKDYWTLMDSHVFLGAVPIDFLGHIEQLHARGVRAVINLCDEYQGPIQKYKKLHIKQLYLPTIDHEEPSVQAMQEAVRFIEEQKNTGVRIYVHCKGGNGRSAAIVFAWLLYKNQKWTPEETQHYMNEKRKIRKKLYTQTNLLAFYQEFHHHKEQR
jgi:atypical dual specificity phosphatase